MTSEHRDLLDGLQTRFYCKSFSESNSGEAIVITEKATGKSLVIQDYDQHDKQRILGVVLPHPADDEPPNRSPPPVPAPIEPIASRFTPLVESVRDISISTSEPSSPSPSSTSSSGESTPPS
uniref:Uncharacterized protein n=1 Tax=Panagrellus redivivus TaxID=6233 RepID=A0A7E4UVS8_PANRE